MDIDDPTEDQAEASGVKSNPEFFLQRGDGVFVPLVALDQLPAWINVGGLSRAYTGVEVADYHGTVLDYHRSGGEYEVRVGHNLGTCQPSPESEGVRDTINSAKGSPIVPNRSFAAKQEMKKQNYQPITPGVMGGKKYCTHWIRTGECDFMQQGCIFLHCIPDLETLGTLGFKSYPRWFREMPYAYQVQNAEGLDSMCPRKPFHRTRNIRGAHRLNSDGVAPAANGYAAPKFRHAWPYPNKGSANHRGHRDHHMFGGAAGGEENANRGYYDTQRAHRFTTAGQTHGSSMNGVQHVHEMDSQDRHQPQDVARVNEAEDYPHDNGYVATPRAYESSDQETLPHSRMGAGSAKHHQEEPGDQRRPMSQFEEEETLRLERQTPKNYYVEPTPETRNDRPDKRTHGGHGSGRIRSQRTDQALPSPNYHAEKPSSRVHGSPRTYRKEHSQRHGNDDSRRQARYPASRHHSSRHNERVRDMPRLKYPPRSGDDGRAKANFYVRTESRSPSRSRVYANRRNDGGPVEDLISFD